MWEVAAGKCHAWRAVSPRLPLTARCHARCLLRCVLSQTARVRKVPGPEEWADGVPRGVRQVWHARGALRRAEDHLYR